MPKPKPQTLKTNTLMKSWCINTLHMQVLCWYLINKEINLQLHFVDSKEENRY